MGQNLDDELGRPEPHLALFDRFAAALEARGVRPIPGRPPRRWWPPTPTWWLTVPVAAVAGLAAYETQAAAIAAHQGRGPAPVVRDGRRRHGVLGRPRRDGGRPRRLGPRRPGAPRCRPEPRWPRPPGAAPTPGGRSSTSGRPRPHGPAGVRPARSRRHLRAPVRTRAQLGADHGDERDHLAGVAAQVVGEGQRPVGVDLPLGRGLAAQLEPGLEEHPQPRRADRVAEALEPAVGVDRQLAVEVEGAGQDLLPRRAPLGEARGPP